MNVRPPVFLAVLSLLFSSVAGLPAPAGAAAETMVVISQGVDTDTLDPLITTVTPSTNVQKQMFDSLVKHDANGKLVPQLATSWRRIAPTVWEFKLVHNAKFWNGDPLTSADVKFSVEKIKDPAYKSQQGPRVSTIERVETPDAYTVHYVTKKPTALIPGFPWLTMIVDAKYWREHGDAYMADHPMGSGPYIFKQWRKDEEVDLDANPNYWGGKPTIDHAVFKPVPEAAARVAALKTGSTDLITNVPVQYASQLENGRTTRMSTAKSDRVLFVAFNTMKPGSQDNKLVRQAINYAVDVPAIVKTVLGGYGTPIATPIPPGFTGYDPKVPFYKHDPAKAKALLAQAGFPDGKGLDLTLNSPSGRYNKDKEVAEAVAGQLSAVGIQAPVKTTEWTNYVNLVGQRALTPMYELGWGNDSYDADNTLGSLLVGDARLSTYSNPSVNKWVDEARYETDPAKRQKLYDQALMQIHDDAPWIFLFQYEDLYGASKRLQWQARGDELIYCTDMKIAS